MEDDDLLLVEAESSVDENGEGCAPYVQCCAWGEDLVRCEVSSNEYLAAEHVLDQERTETLLGLGWSVPTYGHGDEPDEGSANFYIDLERNHADRLAVMTVRAFRDVFGVAHPAFLSADNLGEDTASQARVVESPATTVESDEPLAITPTDREHLQSLVDDALTPVFGHVPEHDEDDDVPVVSGTALVWVRVLEGAPVVHLFAALVRDVVDLERAAFEVAVLNRDVRLIKFVLVEDTVMAHVYLPALPFAPLHLRAMLDLMAQTVDKLDDDLVARIGGARAFEATPDEEPDEESDAEERASMHPAMLTLLQLDAESPGSVDPELAATICEMDRDLILGLITWNSEQEIAWRLARDEAMLREDSGEADVDGLEMRHAELMTNLLRRALRVVVEQQAGRSPTPPYDGPDRRLARRTRGRDEALPGLDDDEQGLWDG